MIFQDFVRYHLTTADKRDAQVLILDEPTAALGARSEFQVFQRFKELSEGKTAVPISHRFSSAAGGRVSLRVSFRAKGATRRRGIVIVPVERPQPVRSRFLASAPSALRSD